jgi:hypothetical protein
MNSETEIFLGVLAVLVGLGLGFAQVNASKRIEKTGTNPGLPIYRFKWWRFGMAVVSVVAGLLIIFNAVNS